VRIDRHAFHDLIVETNPRTKPSRPREEAVIKSLPPAEPSAMQIKREAWNEDQIEFIFGFSRIRRRLQNSKLSGQQPIPTSHPVEHQCVTGNTRQSDPFVIRPGIERIRLGA